MKIKELKIDTDVMINGHSYKYQGVKKIKRLNFGTVQQIVFEGKIKGVLDYKYFDLTVGNKDLKIHDDGKIEFK